MLYDLRILEQGYRSGNADQYASVRAWREAMSRIDPATLPNGFGIQAEVIDPVNYQDQAWFTSMAITQYPVLIIAERQTGTLVTRLNRSDITWQNIYRAIMSLVPGNQQQGTFSTPDGRPVGGDGYWPGGSGGLFNLPWWVWLIPAAVVLRKK